MGAIILFIVLPMLALAAPPADEPVSDKVDPRLADELAINGQANFWIAMAEQADLSAAYDMDWQSRGWYVYNTLAETAAKSQAEVIAYLEAGRLDYEPFWIKNAIYVRGGDLNVIQGLADLPNVVRIKTEEIFYLPDPPAQVEGVEGTFDNWGLDWVNAPDVWALGYDGSGVVAANIDTGVQYNHPQLGSTYRGVADGADQYNWCDPSDVCTGDKPCDNHSHGTHTMGTISGENDDPVSDPNLIGVAPGSTWIACKGCESNSCSEYALTECAQWIVAPTDLITGTCGTSGTANPDKRPHIVNNSWGDVYSDGWYRSYVLAWQAAGIFPAFSAGNLSACGSVGSPGDYQESFSSANIQSNGTVHPSFSSRGPSDFGWDPYCKPNIAAPGTSIQSAIPTNSYGSKTGTSMASPHSAGAVALVWEACPELVGQVDPTIQLLQSTAATSPADPCASTSGCSDVGCNCTYGYGYLDALAAVQSCTGGLDLGYLDGTVSEQGTSNPIEGARVVAVPSQSIRSSMQIVIQESSASAVVGTENEIQDLADSSGYYTMTLLPGTYDVTASMKGYAPETITGVVVISNAVATRNFTLENLGEWQAGPSDAPFEYNRFDGVFDPHDNLIYFLGGRSSVSSHDQSIRTYDPAAGVWADTGCDILRSAANYTAAYIEDDGTGRGEALYVVGGFDITVGTNINAVQRYYPSEPGCVVEEVTSDPFPGTYSGHVIGSGGVGVVDDKIYYFGGWQSQVSPYFVRWTWEFDPQRPAGNRWADIIPAVLDPARSYPNVAVQNGLIYAMGGNYQYSAGDVKPTTVVEVFDPANPGSGWQNLSGMPVATAAGRGFGFQADPLGLNRPGGWLYIAGGGDWPARSPWVLEYDVASDDWNLDFPDLITARRDHAGSYVSVCTPDENDGLPGMWVFGGRVSDSDEPPYGDPEYFAFPCAAPAPPQAGFTMTAVVDSGILDISACAPLTVQFTDISTGTVLERLWDFGDGTEPSDNWRPRHVYTNSGEFEVTLWVTNTSGSDSITKTIVVSSTPEAAFTYSPTVIYTDTAVEFEDTLAGPVVQWLWRLSDGTEYTVQNPTHTFTNPGVYSVTLTVTADSGCSDTSTPVLLGVRSEADLEDITVEASPSSIPIVYGQAAVTATLTLSDSKPAAGWLVTFTIDLGAIDPPTAYSNAEGQAVAALSAGSITGTAHITAQAGPLSDVAPVEFYAPIPPTAEFTTNSPVCLGSFVVFTNTSSGPSEAPIEYLWRFGDGVTSTLESPQRLYGTDGVFTATLTASNVGGSDVYSDAITVKPKSDASFAYDPLKPDPGEQVQFSGTSSSIVLEWAWDFGDGGGASVRDPTHTFTAPGTYTVTLRTRNDCGWGEPYGLPVSVGTHSFYLPLVFKP